MSQLLFAAWVVAGAVVILPLGLLFRAGRRLLGRSKAGAPEKPVTQAARRRTQRLASVSSFVLFVAFIAGAVYHVPHILSWVLDTSHPMASVSSQSMWPTLRKGDLIFLRGVDKPEDLNVGDIIAFRHQKGITVHRVMEVHGNVITTQGDANSVEDEPISFDQVVGRVLTVGGNLVKIPKVGSIAGLFGTSTAPADQPSEQQESSANGSEGAPTSPETGESAAGESASPQPDGAAPGTTELVSVDSAGNQADGFSNWLAISADGRFVAFASGASNLVSGDTNGKGDIFVHDRQTGATERVSVDSAGQQANGHSTKPAVSGDGRFVAFVSDADNLVPGGSNGVPDIFVHDRQTGVTERVSVDSAGNQADGSSGEPAISADGSVVAFESEADNLVLGDTNGQGDVFVRDRQTGVTERVSLDSAGSQAGGGSGGPAISADGRFVAFESLGANLVSDDTNNKSDVFVRDRETGVTERVSVDGDGNQGNDRSDWPAISADGRFVAFESVATNLVSGDTNRQQDIFVHDRQTGATERVSVGSDGEQPSAPTDMPAISADGRFVAFISGANNLVPADADRFYFTDVFVHDRQTGATERVSADSAGNQGNDYSSLAAINADGRFVAFLSLAGNLAPMAGYGQHVFVRERGAATADRGN